MLDGLLARMKGTSGAWGAFLDSTLDRIGDSAVFGGLAIYLARDHQSVLACVALFCLVAGSMVSYARAKAEGIGVRADVGVAERSERLVLVLVVAGLTGLGVPFVLAIGLWVLAVGSTVTFVQRVLVVRKAVGPRAAGQPAAGAAGQGHSVPGSGPGNKAAGHGGTGNGVPGAGPAAAVRDPGESGARKDKA
jgi:CDP-diacylglycerol--glycerol-3-phosphate 3-phosphatidyltransferase